MSTWSDDPGPTEVTFVLAEPEPGTICFNASCQRQQVPATCVLRYPAWLPSSPLPPYHVPLWRESWGKSVPMCDGDMARTISVASTSGLLAVYRVRNDGMLKGLKRWPRELEDHR